MPELPAKELEIRGTYKITVPRDWTYELEGQMHLTAHCEQIEDSWFHIDGFAADDWAIRRVEKRLLKLSSEFLETIEKVDKRKMIAVRTLTSDNPPLYVAKTWVFMKINWRWFFQFVYHEELKAVFYLHWNGSKPVLKRWIRPIFQTFEIVRRRNIPN